MLSFAVLSFDEMSTTYALIMAGGIGSRFWPMSTPRHPKQFLDILGTGRTLLQQTYDRMSRVTSPENIMVATHSQYKDLVMDQLPDLPEGNILLEPARRNTAPCIAYASIKIHKMKPGSSIVVTPADHLITEEDDFAKQVEVAIKHTIENNHLITLGVKPLRPETGYGYIQFKDGDENEPIKKVKTFTEKPDLDLAREFIESGEFLWNSGIFIWNTNAILNAFEKHQPDLYQNLIEGWDLYNTDGEQSFIDKSYPSSDNISVDYGILERSKSVYVLPVSFGWSDLGTWGSVYQEMKKDDHENAIQSKRILVNESLNNIISLDKGKTAIISGLDGYIVIAEGNRLLICPREEEQQIKSFVNDLKISLGEEDI